MPVPLVFKKGVNSPESKINNRVLVVINSKILLVMKRAGGHHNTDIFISMIYLICHK